MTSKIKTIIIDDERIARTRIRNLLKEHQDFELLGEAETGTHALQLVEDSQPDLIFLDISLPGIDGFSILEKAETPIDPIIIVVSGSEEHALKAFDYYAFDYLLKPFRDSRFEKAIANIKNHWSATINQPSKDLENDPNVSERKKSQQSTDNLIPIKNAGKIQFIRTNRIEFIEASGYYIEINTSEKKHLLRESMSRIMDRLDREKFVRIHRSVIINLDCMHEIAKSTSRDYKVRMKNGKVFKVSKSYKKKLFDRLQI